VSLWWRVGATTLVVLQPIPGVVIPLGIVSRSRLGGASIRPEDVDLMRLGDDASRALVDDTNSRLPVEVVGRVYVDDTDCCCCATSS
jgi:hypothetical protein